MTECTETMYEVEITLLADGGVNLEQGANSGSGVQYVSLHRAQVRLLAEMVGLIAPAAPEQNVPSVSELQRTISRLQRALVMARLQAEELASDLKLVADQGHEVLDAEIARAQSMEEFLHFVCADFDSSRSQGQAVTSDTQAMELFEEFVRTNAATLRIAAKFGDGECGAMLDVLQKELQGGALKATPKAAPNPPIGAAAGPLFAEHGGCP